MPDVAPAAPAAAPAPVNGASAKPSAAPVKPNPVSAPPNTSGGKPQAAATPAPQPTVPQKHKWTDKIDGKDVEFEASDEEMRASYRLRSASNKKFEEAARLRRETEAESNRTRETMAKIQDRKHVLKAFKEANPDVDMTQYLADELQVLLDEEEKLQDPNVRERRKLEAELSGYKNQEQERQRNEIKAAEDAETAQHRERWAGLFKEAIGLTKVPVNDITIKMMADAQYTSRQRGWDLTPQQLATSLEKSVKSFVESILGDQGTTDDQLLDAFPALTQRIHRALVGRHNARKNGGGQPQAVAPKPRRLSTEENANQNKQRVLNSKEEAEAYGTKGLRTI